MYLTFEEYIALGGTITDEVTFDDLEYEAESIVNYYTFNRLCDDTEFPEAVKRCIFTLMKLILAQSKYLNPNEDNIQVASQSNDGVSISYNILSASDVMVNSKSQIDRTVNRYLEGVKDSTGRKLLWRGVYENE